MKNDGSQSVDRISATKVSKLLTMLPRALRFLLFFCASAPRRERVENLCARRLEIREEPLSVTPMSSRRSMISGNTCRVLRDRSLICPRRFSKFREHVRRWAFKRTKTETLPRPRTGAIFASCQKRQRRALLKASSLASRPDKPLRETRALAFGSAVISECSCRAV